MSRLTLGVISILALTASVSRAQEKEASTLSPAEFKKLKPMMDVKNQLWTTIPWKYSITEARKLALETRKPIFLNVNTGNCLGSV